MGGNLVATAVLVIVILVSLAAVLLTVVVPALPFVRRVPKSLTFLGTAYFMLIGLGFMFVEIGLMQRLSIFLGHPVFGLAVALAGVILATGFGSALSEFLPLKGTGPVAVWVSLTAGYLASIPWWFPGIVEVFAGSGTFERSVVSLVTILPIGVAMGYGFPTGMRLVSAIDERPTPWFWAVNGAAGVLASGTAVAIGAFVSINASLWTAGVCYLLILPVAQQLSLLEPGTAVAIGAKRLALGGARTVGQNVSLSQTGSSPECD